MRELLAILSCYLAFPACFVAARWLSRGAGLEVDREPLDMRWPEPCWTETIASDGRFTYARAECVHDLLMEMDARARRGDYPVRNMSLGEG